MQTPDSPGAILLDSFRDTLLMAAEIGGNRLLALDETSLQACSEMQGYCIAIEITDLDLQLYCHPGNWGLRLSGNAPAREVDATVSGRLMALLNLAVEEDKLSTSIQERVSFRGDVALAQKLQALLTGLDIDWEEALAQQTGDVAAFQIHQQARRFGHWLQQSADSILQTSGEYLREEARLSPTRPEFDRFQAGVTDTRHAVARAEARLQRIVDRINAN